MSQRERRATIAKIKDLKKNYPRSEALKPLVARLINEDVPRSRLVNPVDTETGPYNNYRYRPSDRTVYATRPSF